MTGGANLDRLFESVLAVMWVDRRIWTVKIHAGFIATSIP